MNISKVPISGLKPDSLFIRSSRILLEDLELVLDVGFHAFEIGNPQRLLVSVEIWLDDANGSLDDDPQSAWNYDVLRSEILRIAGQRRFNLQETLVRALFESLAERQGVRAIRIRSSKPDVYPDARSVGVEIASFDGQWPKSAASDSGWK